MGYKLRCPNCRYGALVRNSIEQHPLLKVMYIQCLNPNCSASYRGQLEFTHLMNRPGVKSPTMQLPMAPSAIRQQAMAALMSDELQSDLFGGGLVEDDNAPEEEGSPDEN